MAGNLEGHWSIDLLKAWCCHCCSLIQNEKESKLIFEGRTAGALGGGDGVVEQQYTRGAGERMAMARARVFGVEEEGMERGEAPLLVDGQAAIQNADIPRCQPEVGSDLHCQHINEQHIGSASPLEDVIQFSSTPIHNLPEQFLFLIRERNTAIEQKTASDKHTPAQASVQAFELPVPTQQQRTYDTTEYMETVPETHVVE